MIRLSGIVTLPSVASLKEEEKWIQKAIEKPGALHKQLDVPQGEKIPAEKLKAASEKGGKLGKRARLAMTLKKLKEGRSCSMEELADIDEMIKALDPVGKEDDDVDNDGDVDSSDKYLKNRRDAISANMHTKKMAETTGPIRLSSLVKEEDIPMTPDDPTKDDHEGEMAKAQLLSLHKQTGELYNMMGDNEELEGWVQDKLAKASDYINSVYNNMQYEKKKPTSIGTGEGTPADGVNKLEEKAPPGWEKTVKAMKKNKKIDNPWALAQYMKNKGYTSHK
jgi:hypothetical protein